MVKKISNNEFTEIKEQSVAFVDFSATWCGPCKMVAPIVEEVSEEMGDKVAFYNVDVDDNPELAEKFGITNIPTLIMLKNGEKVDMQVGFLPKEELVTFVNAQL